MKRIVVCFLCFCLITALTACASSQADDWRKLPAPQEAQPQAEQGPELLPRQVGVQVGPYREMELLPGVPGQNYALMFVRSDGTLDYSQWRRYEIQYRRDTCCNGQCYLLRAFCSHRSSSNSNRQRRSYLLSVHCGCLRGSQRLGLYAYHPSMERCAEHTCTDLHR